MGAENARQGGISVETEHIFPIIKKWLYSEKEIFLREIVSNASDANTKLGRLLSLGQVHDIDRDFRIDVIVDKEAKTLTVRDNGIGMTEEEVRRYLCQIALSGALEFIEKYEDTADGKGGANGIIGHFGLGFYSAFMVASTVEVKTKSYQDTPAVLFTCDESGAYTIDVCDKAERGTDVILHITEEEAEFLEESKIRAVLSQYCAFMPQPIYLEIVGAQEQKTEDGAIVAPEPINDTAPLWQKLPSECTEEEYESFYHKVFTDFRKPLFHIHINADYPLNFKGILYFPALNHEYESLEGQVKLYYNQVFVADNMKEIIPEYMLMLRGVLDCPELPLNVSRSYLQNNTYVAKVQAHIAKKVCDKLNSMKNTEWEEYQKLWGALKLFVEYACMCDRKFYDRAKDALLLACTDGTYCTIAEYLEAAKESHENTVYYTTDAVAQAQYVALFAGQGVKVACFDNRMDTQFISFLESQEPSVKFLRVDAELASTLKAEGEAAESEALTALFRAASGAAELKVEYQNLKDTSIPALLHLSEQSRRMEDMMRMYRMQMGGGEEDSFALPQELTLTVNAQSPLICKLAELVKTDEARATATAKQIYMLALLSQRALSARELQDFLQDSYTLLEQGLN